MSWAGMNRTPICRDFQRGSCRFGSRCKFSHNTSQQQRQQLSNPFGLGFKNQAQQQPKGENYYSPLVSQRQDKNQSQVAVKEHRCVDPKECKQQIKEDLEHELTACWKLTCYAHGKLLPNDIVGDVSFEELRAHAYAAGKQGMSFDSVVQNERNMVAAKKKELELLLNNPYSGPASSASNGSFRDNSLHQEASRMSFGTGAKVSPSSPFGISNSVAGPMGGSGFSFGLGAANAVTTNLSSPPQNPSDFGFSFGVHSSDPKPATQVSSPQNLLSSGSQLFSGFGQMLSNSTPARINTSPAPHNVLLGSNMFQTTNEADMSDSLPSPNFLSVPAQDSEQHNSIFHLPAKPAVAFPKQSEGASDNKADVWLKENWNLGEIPEEEPPLYAR